ncbi:BatD family protein [Catalinimonas alkaloidigena]|uniref:BatD family protein n=1 Tax=Catalinimonas alkaloidigena TaxID=1075417 RepID=UPI001FDF1AFC|nr:BatD family protein [Catalinimonas alkaloidigena]
MGKSNIAFNEAYTITITVTNEDLRSYGKFPDIPGFVKRGTTSSTSTNIVNGQISSTQSITQNYMAEKEGTFTIPPFELEINNNKYNSPGGTVVVGPPAQAKNSPDQFGFDPFEDWFNQDEPREFVDVKEDAFLALTTSESEVYVGEGFNTTLAFYIAETNRADMSFHELGQQLSEILKKLRPTNCWEENFNIEEIQPRNVTLNGKRYTQYKVYQATFYPLNTEPVQFPSVGLRMIKYKIAKTPSFFGRNRQEEYKTFYTSPKIVQVRELPPHPLRDRVSVGEFRLEEAISGDQLSTGESFSYQFNIVGEGNISAIKAPEVPKNEYFDFYAPSVNQEIKRSNNRVTGKKVFEYFAVPNEAGTYSLGDYFQWVFFDPRKERYDTLQSQVEVQVSGESQKNAVISGNSRDDYYETLQAESNHLLERNLDDWVKILANGSILLMLGVTIFALARRPS